MPFLPEQNLLGDPFGISEFERGLDWIISAKRFSGISHPESKRLYQFLANQEANPEGFSQEKTYPNSTRFGLQLSTENPQTSLNSVLCQRHTTRRFVEKPLDFKVFSYLLTAAYGRQSHLADDLKDQAKDSATERRTVGSGGGLYPLEIYVVALNVDGLPRGFYHYNGKDHCVELLCADEPQNYLKDILVSCFSLADLRSALKSSFIMMVNFVPGRCTLKYGEFGWALGLLEAGMVSQNLALACASQGLGAWQQGRIVDDKFEKLAEIDGVNEVWLTGIIVGHPE